MLFCEELTNLVTFLRFDPDAVSAVGDDKAAKEAIRRAENEWRVAMGHLAEIARLGRSVRVSVVASVQHAIADNLGPAGFGSTIRSVLNARIAIGKVEPEAMLKLFPGAPATISHVMNRLDLGRAVVAGLSSDTGSGTQVARMCLVSQGELRLAVADLTDDVPDFDDVGLFEPRIVEVA